MNSNPESFTLRVPDEVIADLRNRLRLTRFPDQAPGEPWAYGTDVGWMQDLVTYWRSGFDWRAQEARLNAFPPVTRVPALTGSTFIFFTFPAQGDNPVPAFCFRMAGRDRFFEFLDLIPRLTDPPRASAAIRPMPSPW